MKAVKISKCVTCIITLLMIIFAAIPVVADEPVPEAPYLVSSSPYNGQTGVDIYTSVTCSFSSDVTGGYFSLTRSGGGNADVNASFEGSFVTVTPASSLEYSSIYTLYISGIAGPGGEAAGDYSITFVTGPAPEPVTAEAPEPTTAPEPATTGSSGGGGGNGSGSGNGQGSGNGTGGGAGRSIPVEVQSFYPWDGATDIPVDVTMSCQFTHNVAEASISGANISHVSLWKYDGTNVPVYAYVADTQIEFDKRQFIYAQPTQALEPGTQYTLYVTAGVTAKNGMSSTYDQQVTFTTQGTRQQAAETTASGETSPAQTTASTTASATTPETTVKGQSDTSSQTTAGTAVSKETASGETTSKADNKGSQTADKESDKDTNTSEPTAAADSTTEEESAQPIQTQTGGLSTAAIIIIIAAVVAAAAAIAIVLFNKKRSGK